MKAARHHPSTKSKKMSGTVKVLRPPRKRYGVANEPGRRRLGLFEGMPGYYMSDDFCTTTTDEFDA